MKAIHGTAMINLPTYHQVELLSESVSSVVYRGYRVADSHPVILKAPNAPYPSSTQIIEFKHEFELLNHLHIPGVIRAEALAWDQQRPILILEDCGGTSLARLDLIGKIDIPVFLNLALSIVECVGSLHTERIVHKDLNPSNIILNPNLNIVQLIDFGISSVIPRESVSFGSPQILEGTLPYLSPEQTGRMNRVIDYRSDFYALGITFYQLLTGQLPFWSEDPLELIHSHIAKQPVLPSAIRSDLPPIIDHMIIKLIAKNAEDRYQSAMGLKADLQACLDSWTHSQQIDIFPLGSRDYSENFAVGQKLYGRESELDRLVKAFEQVDQGAIQFMLISGYSGVGKSALVHELHRPLTGRRGLFISGKFEQYKRDIPYYAISQALNELCTQLLTTSESILTEWRLRILNALGSNGQLLIDIAPQLEWVIGKQPPVDPVGSKEAQNRFILLFQRFVQCISSADHPLVLFLDDLQWADPASLTVLQALIAYRELSHLLLIGAYRDNEVDPTHPLMLALNSIKQTDPVGEIHLNNLSFEHVHELISDSLNQSLESCFSLSTIVYEKTLGNAFFTTEFLKSLYTNHYIAYDFDSQQWRWDPEIIKAQGFTDNVVELMSSQIIRLPDPTQRILTLAACIGNRFDLSMLVTVALQTAQLVQAALLPAIQAGLIKPSAQSYLMFGSDLPMGSDPVESEFSFVHDRIQQAAYGLLDLQEQQQTHYQIGTLKLRNLSSEQTAEDIFDSVYHLNQGCNLATDPAERTQLIRLNLQAGKEAKNQNAFGSAMNYLRIGLTLLPENAWIHDYSLTWELQFNLLESAYMNREFSEAGTLAEILLAKARSSLEIAKIRETQILYLIAQNQMLHAIEIGLVTLENLGIPLSASDPVIPDIRSLSALDLMSSPTDLTAMKILVLLHAPIYIAKPELLPTVIYTTVNLCIQKGNSPLAPFAYAYYGLLLCGLFSNFEQGYQMGQLAEQLQTHLRSKDIQCKVEVLLSACIKHWHDSAIQSTHSLQEAVRTGLDTGDFEYACTAISTWHANSLLVGLELDSVSTHQQLYKSYLIDLKQDFYIQYSRIWEQVIFNLQNKPEQPSLLQGRFFDEAIDISYLEETKNFTSLFAAHLAKLILCFLFGNDSEGVIAAQQARHYQQSAVSLITSIHHPFYESLILLRYYPKADPQTQAEYLMTVEANLARLRHCAQAAPMNYEHKVTLIAAEQARIRGQEWAAMRYYQTAIQQARQSQWIHEEGMACELAGEFYLAREYQDFARSCIVRAHNCYAQWQAHTKVFELEQRYPQFLGRQLGLPSSTITTQPADQSAVSRLDFGSILKASQALSTEIVLDQLLIKLIQILIENAGAQRAYLILESAGSLKIAAAGSVDQTQIITTALTDAEDLPISLINYVFRIQSPVVLENASSLGAFSRDPYISQHLVKSVICAPLLNQGQLAGIVYLENNLMSGAFTAERLEVLSLLSGQAAIAITNARLYEEVRQNQALLADYNRSLEDQVSARTQQLTATLDKLKTTQRELVLSEKMAALGQLIANIAHEINTPLGAIRASIGNIKSSIDDYLKRLPQLFQQLSADQQSVFFELLLRIDANPALLSPREERQCRQALSIELDSYHLPHSQTLATTLVEIGITGQVAPLLPLLNDQSHLDLILQVTRSLSIHIRSSETISLAIERVSKIVFALKTYSRKGSDGEKVKANILDTLEVVLTLYHSMLKQGIEVVRDLREVPELWCYPDELSQVWTNLIQNSIQAMKGEGILTLKVFPHDHSIIVEISDTGSGIPPEYIDQIFEPFFTLKPIGEGSGLGLDIVRRIIDKHQGTISVASQPGLTTFKVSLPIQGSLDGGDPGGDDVLNS